MSPATQELYRAMQNEIRRYGEARNISRIVGESCTLPLSYAYVLLKVNHANWRLVKRKHGREIVFKPKEDSK